MLAHLTSVTYQPRNSEPVAVFGPEPSPDVMRLLSDMGRSKPGMKKLDTQMVACLPAGGEGTVGWVFDKVAPVTELPGLKSRLSELSKTYAAAPDDLPAPAAGALALIICQLSHAGKLRRTARMQAAVDVIAETGLAAKAAIVAFRNGRFTKAVYSDRSLTPFADVLRVLLKQHQRAESATLTFDAHASEPTEAALLTEAAGAGTLICRIPSKGSAGFALCFFGPAHGADKALDPLEGLLGLATGTKLGPVPRRRWKGVLKAGVPWALATALAVFLALPAPLTVTVSALSEPGSGRTVALPFDAFLDSMRVEVGDMVEAGQILAMLKAPDLDYQRSQVEMETSVERIVAQTALSENDYGAYTLAEQRIATNTERLLQIETKLDQLTIRAPVSGTIVSALGNGNSGQFVATGDAITVVQDKDAFQLLLTVPRVDAALLRAGQSGEVYFRGLPGDTFAFTLQTPVFEQAGPGGTETRLVARARIERGGRGQLFSGLSGFARVTAGERARIFVWSRYVIEYAKVKAWTYLGLRF